MQKLIVVYFMVVFVFSILPFDIKSSYAAGSYSFIKKWGSHGSGNGQFDSLQNLAVDSSNHVYVVDQGNNRV